jgi:hypothetical protein
LQIGIGGRIGEVTNIKLVFHFFSPGCEQCRASAALLHQCSVPVLMRTWTGEPIVHESYSANIQALTRETSGCLMT